MSIKLCIPNVVVPGRRFPTSHNIHCTTAQKQARERQTQIPTAIASTWSLDRHSLPSSKRPRLRLTGESGETEASQGDRCKRSDLTSGSRVSARAAGPNN